MLRSTLKVCVITDSIEANVERSALNVGHGTEQLLQARDYQVCAGLADLIDFLPKKIK